MINKYSKVHTTRICLFLSFVTFGKKVLEGEGGIFGNTNVQFNKYYYIFGIEYNWNFNILYIDRTRNRISNRPGL